jgi:hypothetical protein
VFDTDDLGSEIAGLRGEVARLEGVNKTLAAALAAVVGEQPNPADLLLGAALAGGDVVGLARRLATQPPNAQTKI